MKTAKFYFAKRASSDVPEGVNVKKFTGGKPKIPILQQEVCMKKFLLAQTFDLLEEICNIYTIDLRAPQTSESIPSNQVQLLTGLLFPCSPVMQFSITRYSYHVLQYCQSFIVQACQNLPAMPMCNFPRPLLSSDASPMPPKKIFYEKPWKWR